MKPNCSGNVIKLRILQSKRPWALVAQAQNLRVGGYTENVLKWFDYPHARAHPGCKVSCHGTASSVRPRFVEASPTVEKAVSCYKADRLVASLPQRSVVACNTQISCCRGRTLRTKPRTGVCETLMPDVVAPKESTRTIAAM